MPTSHFMTDLLELAAAKVERGAMDRRSFLALAAAIGAGPGAALGSGAAAAAPHEIVVANFGGDAVKYWQQAWGDPYTKRTGIPVKVVGDQPTEGKITAMVKAGRVLWDVANGDGFNSIDLARNGIVEKVDYTSIDKSKIPEQFLFDYGVSALVYSTVLGYNKAKTGGKEPRGYVDFLNFKDFPGKRAVFKWLVGSLEAILLGDGVPADKLYPLDVKRAFARIKEHRDDLILWGGGGQAQQLFRNDEVVMGNLWSTRATVMHRETSGRITWTWNEGIVAPGILMVPKGAPAGAGEAFKFIASTQDPQGQLELFKTLGAGPVNPATLALVPAELNINNPTYPENYKKQIPINSQWYADNYAKVQNDFIDLFSS